MTIFIGYDTVKRVKTALRIIWDVVVLTAVTSGLAVALAIITTLLGA